LRKYSLMKYLLFVLLIPLAAKSQLVLEATKKIMQYETSNFQIASIIDSFQTKNIGSIFLADQQNTKFIKINNSADRYFTDLLKKNTPQNTSTDTVLLVIKNLQLIERKSNGSVKGEISLTISYLSKENYGDVFLISKTSKALYQRTFGSATPSNFENLIAKAFGDNLKYFSDWKNLNLSYHEAFVKSSEVMIKPPYNLNVNDTIYYGSRPINWKDFSGKPVGSNRYDAAIFANIAFDLEMSIENQILKAYFTPKVYMVQGMSWVRNSNLSNYSLEHERLHFDIAKIAMNRYVKSVEQINELTPEDLQSRVQYEYLEAYREMNRLQKMYDDETGHGINQMAQASWRNKIVSMLKE
jgi:hypothetical protein